MKQNTYIMPLKTDHCHLWCFSYSCLACTQLVVRFLCMCDRCACLLADGHVDPSSALTLAQRWDSEEGYSLLHPPEYRLISSCLLKTHNMQILYSLLPSHHFCNTIYLSQPSNHFAIFPLSVNVQPSISSPVSFHHFAYTLLCQSPLCK